VKDEWTSEVVSLDKFKCVSPEEICKNDLKPDVNKIRKIEIAVSKQPGDAGGSGTLIIDNIWGVLPDPVSCDYGGSCKLKDDEQDSIWGLIVGGSIFLVVGVLVYFVMKRRKLNQQKEKLKNELDSLNTNGFESEAMQLKSRIENIKTENEINEIEEKLNELRIKIDDGMRVKNPEPTPKHKEPQNPPEEKETGGHIKRDCFLCGQLAINASKSRDTTETLKWIRAIEKYAKCDDSKDIKGIIDELLYNMQNSREISDELTKKIEVVVHHIQMR